MIRNNSIFTLLWYPLRCTRAQKYFIANYLCFSHTIFVWKVEVCKVGRQMRVCRWVCHDFHRLDDFAIATILLWARHVVTHVVSFRQKIRMILALESFIFSSDENWWTIKCPLKLIGLLRFLWVARNFFFLSFLFLLSSWKLISFD